MRQAEQAWVQGWGWGAALSVGYFVSFQGQHRLSTSVSCWPAAHVCPFPLHPELRSRESLLTRSTRMREGCPSAERASGPPLSCTFSCGGHWNMKLIKMENAVRQLRWGQEPQEADGRHLDMADDALFYHHSRSTRWCFHECSGILLIQNYMDISCSGQSNEDLAREGPSYPFVVRCSSLPYRQNSNSCPFSSGCSTHSEAFSGRK